MAMLDTQRRKADLIWFSAFLLCVFAPFASLRDLPNVAA
jgi:hypothetical protein